MKLSVIVFEILRFEVSTLSGTVPLMVIPIEPQFFLTRLLTKGYQCVKFG